MNGVLIKRGNVTHTQEEHHVKMKAVVHKPRNVQSSRS